MSFVIAAHDRSGCPYIRRDAVDQKQTLIFATFYAINDGRVLNTRRVRITDDLFCSKKRLQKQNLFFTY